MTALIVLGCIALYFVAGVRLAHRGTRAQWVKALDKFAENYPSLASGDKKYQEKSVRGDVLGWWWLMVFFWPIMFAIRVIGHPVAASVDAGNPVLRERQLTEARARIAELERELGM